MHNAPLFLIYLLYFKNLQLLNRFDLDPCVYDIFNSESALELNPELVTLTLGTSCISIVLTVLFLCPQKVQEHFNMLEQEQKGPLGYLLYMQLIH